MKQFLPLKISSNERPPELVDTIRGVVGPDKIEVVHLAEADYAVGRACVERKKVGNLVSSMVKEKGEDKELWEQLDRCLAAYDRVYLLVEGSLEPTTDPGCCYADHRYRRVGYLAVQAALVKAQDKGVKLVWTTGYQETALVLKWLHGKYKNGGAS